MSDSSNEPGWSPRVPLEECRAALVALRDGTKRIGDEHNSQPAPNSRADPATWPKHLSSTAINCFGFSQIKLEFAADHISALLRLSVEPLPAWAMWTTVRSMLEPCAASAYLTEPGIANLERAGRVLHVRHEGIKREMRLARGDTDIQRRGNAAMAKIEQTAAAIQVQVISSKKGTRSVHRSPSSVTEAIEESLSLGDAYRILSQIAHAHTMSLINAGMVELRQPAETSGQRVVMLERRVLADHAAFLFATAFRAFSRAAWSHARYFGWDELRFEEIIDNAADRIRLAPAVRFWRS